LSAPATTPPPSRRIASFAIGANNFAVNSVCPGWVQTEMGGPNATRNLAIHNHQ
jgi:NAD(P)-dependent dehydrogenase (short-subunit alcohol dehydrogenase family)